MWLYIVYHLLSRQLVQKDKKQSLAWQNNSILSPVTHKPLNAPDKRHLDSAITCDIVSKHNGIMGSVSSVVSLSS